MDETTRARLLCVNFLFIFFSISDKARECKQKIEKAAEEKILEGSTLKGEKPFESGTTKEVKDSIDSTRFQLLAKQAIVVNSLEKNALDV